MAAALTGSARGGRLQGVTSARTISAEQFRALLAERHAHDGVIEPDAVANADLVFNLMRLHARLVGDFEALHRRHGWTWAGWRIMNVLWAVGPAGLRDVARLSGASRAAVSSALNTLQRDGLVERCRATADRRLVRLVLTALGEGRLQAAMRDQAGRERAWFSALAPGDRRRLAGLLHEVGTVNPEDRTQHRSSRV